MYNPTRLDPASIQTEASLKCFGENPTTLKSYFSLQLYRWASVGIPNDWEFPGNISHFWVPSAPTITNEAYIITAGICCLKTL